MQRVAFFQQAAKEATEPFTIDSIRALIQTYDKALQQLQSTLTNKYRYLHRNDEELSKLKKERRPGRPSSTREDMLKQKAEMERKEFETGFSRLPWKPHPLFSDY